MLQIGALGFTLSGAALNLLTHTNSTKSLGQGTLSPTGEKLSSSHEEQTSIRCVEISYLTLV